MIYVVKIANIHYHQSHACPSAMLRYCIKPNGKAYKFASLSTRNGNRQYYWKDLNGLSSKVALSALETHGSVDGILAGESDSPIGDILQPEQLEAVLAVFKRLVGAETLAKFSAAEEEAVSDDSDPPPDEESDEEAKSVKSEVKAEAPPAVSAKKAGRAKAVDAESAEATKESKKRVARMALVDELKTQAEGAQAAEKASKRAKSEPKLVD